MKFIPIFGEENNEQIIALAISKEGNEYDLFINKHTDIEYLREFAIKYKIKNIKNFITEIQIQVEYIEDTMYQIDSNKLDSETKFKSYHNQEFQNKALSLQKLRIKNHKIRLYAVRVDKNRYVVVGGAIKIVQDAEKQDETLIEVNKMKQVQSYLKENGEFDKESLFELILD